MTIAAFATVPGLIDPTSSLFPLIAFFPQVVGGGVFWIANAVLMFAEQDNVWGFKLNSAKWQSAFLGSSGGFGFMLTGLLLLIGDFSGAAWASLIGSIAFLLGSIAGWYDIMQLV